MRASSQELGHEAAERGLSRDGTPNQSSASRTRTSRWRWTPTTAQGGDGWFVRNAIRIAFQVGPLQNSGGPTQTIALASDSPAIDAGDETVCAAPPVSGLDQRGFARPGSGATNCSIGAYEFNATRCLLDVDRNGVGDVSTDVAYINRRLLMLTPVPPSFRAIDPSIPPDATIATNIDAIRSSLDVDANGNVDSATDIVYITRRLFHLTPVPPSFRLLDRTIPSDAVIAQRIDALCP